MLSHHAPLRVPKSKYNFQCLNLKLIAGGKSAFDDKLKVSCPADPVTMIPIHVKHIQQRIHDVVIQEQDSVMLNSTKLAFYKNIYKIQTRAHYVDIISCRSDRSILAKLRVRAHKLTIEKGIHIGIPRQNRICTFCNTGPTQNEQHFLLECTAYKFLREEFFLKLNRLGINVSVPLCVRNISGLYWLLNKKNVIVIKMLVKYIRSLFDTRETLL